MHESTVEKVYITQMTTYFVNRGNFTVLGIHFSHGDFLTREEMGRATISTKCASVGVESAFIKLRTRFACWPIDPFPP